MMRLVFAPARLAILLARSAWDWASSEDLPPGPCLLVAVSEEPVDGLFRANLVGTREEVKSLTRPGALEQMAERWREMEGN